MKAFAKTFIALILVGLASCNSNTTDVPNRQEVATSVDEQYLERGQAITSLTFKTMSGHLKSALETGGVSNAVKYCNLAAEPLVDSLAKAYDVQIKRTSHKLRNTNNKPTKQEIIVMEQYLSNPNLRTPQIDTTSNTVHYYSPILIMDNCLKCHGVLNKDVLASDYAIIKELYPNDQAVGFKLGDLRGIWSLEFSSSSPSR